MCCPRALARLRPTAVRVQIRSRTTSASLHSTPIITPPPVLVGVSANGPASDRTCPPGSTVRLTMANWSKVERDRSVPLWCPSRQVTFPPACAIMRL